MSSVSSPSSNKNGRWSPARVASLREEALSAATRAFALETLESRQLLTGTLLDLTLFGGSGDDVFRDGVVASDGSVYLAGSSVSGDVGPMLPSGGYDRTPNGNGDGLVVR